eukprot:TRINITY_DN7250_c1_g1_i1.p1 TRINITY_DN7250_c1_g1~~TRINITY_DN7250_c1_g1_i1.p1  ORF type:complete len:180 (+),score=37.32 TRINITY_DN7250_c1_g1_i1:12-551(+)
MHQLNQWFTNSRLRIWKPVQKNRGSVSGASSSGQIGNQALMSESFPAASTSPSPSPLPAQPAKPQIPSPSPLPKHTVSAQSTAIAPSVPTPAEPQLQAPAAQSNLPSTPSRKCQWCFIIWSNWESSSDVGKFSCSKYKSISFTASCATGKASNPFSFSSSKAYCFCTIYRNCSFCTYTS